MSDKQAAGLRVAASQDHEPLPTRGTLKLASGEELIGPPMPWHFPLLASCSGCKVPIRKADSLLAEWEHVE